MLCNLNAGNNSVNKYQLFGSLQLKVQALFFLLGGGHRVVLKQGIPKIRTHDVLCT